MDDQLIGTLSTTGQLYGELTVAESVPTYSGSYEVTPTDETQTIPCGGWLMAQDITINPIPSNYGHVAWNGVTLTVS